MVGNLGFFQPGSHVHGLTVLTEALTAHYGAEHEVLVYEAAVYPVCEPVIQRLPLAELPMAQVTEVSTLYVPPVAAAPVDHKMMARLGMNLSSTDGKSQSSSGER